MSDPNPDEADALSADWGYPTTDESDAPQGESDPDIAEVEQTVLDEFDSRIWRALEAVLSAQATLLLDDVDACTGIVIAGASGTGKTTVLQFLTDATFIGKDLVYKCDDFTHAAFVSHDTSKDEDELAEADLLPHIRHRTLAAMDMNTWFSGGEEAVRQKMSYFARVMDGDGLMRNTGGHGRRGYEGDYRFVLAGATTPLQTRAWDVMGHVGNRLLFHEMPREDDIDEVTDDVFGDTGFPEKRSRCRSVVGEFLGQLWQNHGGYGSVQWETTDDRDVREGIAYLANLVSHARAPVEQVGDRNEPQREGAHRVMMALRNLARGHALMHGRREIEMEDVEVAARVALSTMHRKRRGIVRAVVDPETSQQMKTSEITAHDATDAAKNTILRRMELLEDLDIGAVKAADQGRQTRTFALYDDFVWPDQLSFPG